MAEHSSFFNSVSGDRLYKAEDFAKYFSSFISDGIFPDPSTNLQALVSGNNDMNIIVKAGSAWINGYFYYLDTDTTFTIGTADGTLNRIDRIVVHLDIAGRAINVKVLKGIIASSPTAPTLQRDADGYDLALADIAINAGVTSISQSNITDQRQNQDLCGIVDSLITADTATLFNQFTDGFNSWFAGIKNTLGEDAAGNLLNKINDLAGAGRTDETVKGNADNIKVLDQSVNTHLADNVYQIAGGTATAITITIGETLVNGLPVNFVANANNNGAATTINGKPLYKPNTTIAPNLIAGKAYTVWYNSTGNCFFIKASATGTVTSDKVLAGETYSTEIDTDLVGTMPNRGSFNLGLGASVPAGYYSGGTAPSGKKFAKGSYSQTIEIHYSNNQVINDLGFVPDTVFIYVEEAVYNTGGATAFKSPELSLDGYNACKQRDTSYYLYIDIFDLTNNSFSVNIGADSSKTQTDFTATVHWYAWGN